MPWDDLDSEIAEIFDESHRIDYAVDTWLTARRDADRECNKRWRLTPNGKAYIKRGRARDRDRGISKLRSKRWRQSHAGRAYLQRRSTTAVGRAYDDRRRVRERVRYQKRRDASEYSRIASSAATTTMAMFRAHQEQKRLNTVNWMEPPPRKPPRNQKYEQLLAKRRVLAQRRRAAKDAKRHVGAT